MWKAWVAYNAVVRPRVGYPVTGSFWPLSAPFLLPHYGSSGGILLIRFHGGELERSEPVSVCQDSMVDWVRVAASNEEDICVAVHALLAPTWASRR